MCATPSRHQASRDDLVVYSALSQAPDASSYPHAARWYSHIKALLGARWVNISSDLMRLCSLDASLVVLPPALSGWLQVSVDDRSTLYSPSVQTMIGTAADACVSG
jgi:hypothetical protein